MRALARILGRLLVFGLILLLAFGVVGYALAQRARPVVAGEVTVPGLDDEVRVWRDGAGVPHIYASSPHDLFLAQGFVHAQDRFWQMDFWRHIGAGRTAEMFGAGQVEADAFLRTLGWEATARTELADLPGPTRDILESYADGVNAYMADRSPTELSAEYAVLKLQNWGYVPDRWEPINTLTWAKVIAWDLRANFEDEIERAILGGTLPAARVEELYPPYPERHPVIAPGRPQAVAAAFSPPAPTRLTPLLARVVERAATVDALTGPAGEGIGSNNWVVSGERTTTGLPLLANDPHLSIQMPSIWYQVGLHCRPKGPACPYDVVGFSFAGAPGIVIGHNDRIAWGVTNLGPDTMDLYIERVNPQNPDQYEVDGEWVDMEVALEQIEVAGSDPVTIRVRKTQNGTIISDSYGPLEDFDQKAGVGVPPDHAIALRWTALEPSTVIRSFLELDVAATWDEFRAALRHFDIAAQNFVYADVDGNIGYQATGRIPIRRNGDGRWPARGWTGENEWTGFIPFDELPSVLNPSRGFLVTANNAVVDADYPYHLSSDWAYGYRAQRIDDLLATQPALTLEAMSAIQFDSRNGSAAEVVPHLLAMATNRPEVGRAQATLRAWAEDGDEAYQQRAGSPGSALYAAIWRQLLARTFHDELPADHWPEGGSRWFEVVRLLLDDPDNAWWDDARTEQVETRDAILTASLLAALEELTERFGDDPSEWNWEEMHGAVFRNQSLGVSGIGPIEALFNRGPYPVSGGTSLVNATSWYPPDGYEVTWVPSLRMVVDLADFDASRALHTTGQSGHIFDPHYRDLVERWAGNEPLPFSWSDEAVAELTVDRLTLSPR